MKGTEVSCFTVDVSMYVYVYMCILICTDIHIYPAPFPVLNYEPYCWGQKTKSVVDCDRYMDISMTDTWI